MNIKYDDIVQPMLDELRVFQTCYSKELYMSFKDRFEGLKPKIEASLQEGRALKIGIVGEVKAGKSSFLNALLFKGQDLLPHASTPMTAALTKISYGEKQSAKIIFYSEKDWENIAILASEYDKQIDDNYNKYKKEQEKNITKIRNKFKANTKSKEELISVLRESISDDIKSCKELVDMYQKSNINLYTLLGTSKEINIDNINTDLAEYIGANGAYTPIVKHVELKMNEPILKDFEIVDTPGLNDPILSRSQTTKRFLSECDVVFLLSYTGQFLTQEDIAFMSNTLPKEGVREIIIVGSKFDSGLLDYNKSKNLKEAINKTVYIYNEQARENINNLLLVSPNKDRIQHIKEYLPPIYISSYLYGAALRRKNNLKYTIEQEHIIGRLRKQFNDFVDDPNILSDLSRIPEIQSKKLMPLKAAREKLIDDKNKQILLDEKNILLELLGKIDDQITANKINLENSDKNQLEEKMKIVEKGLNSVRREVKSVIEEVAIDIATSISNLKNEMVAAVNNHKDITVSSHIDEKRKGYDEGWWIFKTRKYYIETTNNYEADVSDVMSNIQSYIVEARKIADGILKKAVDCHKLEKQLKEVILKGFDMGDEFFDEREILVPLSLLVKGINATYIEIDDNSYMEKIADKFPSGAKNEQIHQLKIMQTSILGEVCRDLQVEIDKSINSTQLELKVKANTLVDSLINTLQENYNNLKIQLENKENSLAQYNQLSKNIKEYNYQIKEMVL